MELHYWQEITKQPAFIVGVVLFSSLLSFVASAIAFAVYEYFKGQDNVQD